MKQILHPNATIQPTNEYMTPEEAAYVATCQKQNVTKLLGFMAMIDLALVYVIYTSVTSGINLLSPEGRDMLIMILVLVALSGLVVVGVIQGKKNVEMEQGTPMKLVYTTTLERKKIDDGNEYELYFKDFLDDVELKVRKPYDRMIVGETYIVHLSQHTAIPLHIIEQRSGEVIFTAL